MFSPWILRATSHTELRAHNYYTRFKHSHWWKMRSWSKFASHYAWGTNGVCECKKDVKSTWILAWHKWIMFHGHLDCSQKPPLGGRPNTKPGDRSTPNIHNHWFILCYHVWGLAWIKINWNSMWLKAWSHVTSHYTWGFVTTLHDFGGVLGQPLDTFFWVLTISWSFLACVWSGPKESKQQVQHNFFNKDF